MPRRRQAGEGQCPVEKTLALGRCGGRQHRNLALESSRRQRRRGVGIAQDVDEVERPFAEKTLGVDGEPAAFTAVENVAVVDIAMQHHDIARIGQKRLRGPICRNQQAAMCPRRWRQGLEPTRQGNELRRWSGARRMQSYRHLAENAACLVVATDGDDGRQRARTAGALQQQGLAVPGQNPRRAFTIPPRHHARDWSGSSARINGNSIFIYAIADLCIAHLGHLHHRLTKEHLDELGRIDVLMVPIDGAYTMGMPLMVDVIRQVQPKIVLPMHYWGRSQVSRFESLMAELDADFVWPDRRTIEVVREELPEKLTVMVVGGNGGD